MRKRIVRKRCLYDFTLRAIHQYYRDNYNKILKGNKYEEHDVPILSNITEGNYQQTSFVMGKRTSMSQARVNFVNQTDMTDLDMTKDITDFDRNFLRYLKISIEQERKGL